MAASTITIKLSPGEYEALKAELLDQKANLAQFYRETPPGPARQIWSVRMSRLEKLLKEI